MRNPVAPLAPQAIGRIDAKPDTLPRQGTRDSRSFAELLAEAEAVQDLIEIRSLREDQRAGSGGVQGTVQGALHGAADSMARQIPWMGLPLLLRRPSPPPRAARDSAD